MFKDLLDIAILLTDGVKYTATLFVVTMIGSLPLGLLLTFMRTGKSRILRASSLADTELFHRRNRCPRQAR